MKIEKEETESNSFICSSSLILPPTTKTTNPSALIKSDCLQSKPAPNGAVVSLLSRDFLEYEKFSEGTRRNQS